MKRSLTVLVLSLLCLFGAPVNAPAPIVSHNYYYYADRFTTLAGEEHYTCDDDYWSSGTLDGLFMRYVWEGCLGGNQTGGGCSEKVDGSWSPIPCP